jgi:hypothetical protein
LDSHDEGNCARVHLLNKLDSASSKTLQSARMAQRKR